MPLFPNVEFLRYVAEERPHCIEQARFALQTLGTWDEEIRHYDEEIKGLLGGQGL